MMSKKCCGIRLNPRRLSVHRLRTNFLYLFRVFKRWKKNWLRLLRAKMARGSRRDDNNNNNSVDDTRINEEATSSFCAVRRMAHSNSFCSEAIADCVEFIKRNSVSIDDNDTNPMLTQDQ